MRFKAAFLGERRIEEALLNEARIGCETPDSGETVKSATSFAAGREPEGPRRYRITVRYCIGVLKAAFNSPPSGGMSRLYSIVADGGAVRKLQSECQPSAKIGLVSFASRRIVAMYLCPSMGLKNGSSPNSPKQAAKRSN